MPPRTSIENEEAIVVPVTITGGEGGIEDGVGVVVGEGGNTGLLKRYSLVFQSSAGRNSHQVDGAGSKGQHMNIVDRSRDWQRAYSSELLATKT